MPSKYAHILSFVEQEIARRDARPGGALAPSDYWKDYNAYSSYIRTLPDEELKYLRRHTWHLTGDIYSSYQFVSERRRRDSLALFEPLLRQLGGFVPQEPPNGIGMDTPYGRINSGILRYSVVLADLHGAGYLPRSGARRVLELGGGYGGLALLCLQFNPQLAYVLCDLEESLFVQGVFLTQQLGTERVSLVRGEGGDLDQLRPGQVYLLPQSRADALQRARFDLAINQQSMQEMTPLQVARYSDILAQCSEYFYSCNRRKHGGSIPQEKGLITNLHQYLGARFAIAWDSTEHLGALVGACQRHNLLRKLVTAFIGSGFLPRGEAGLRRFVYRCGAPPAARKGAEAA
jgi:hypothetical protein